MHNITSLYSKYIIFYEMHRKSLYICHTSAWSEAPCRCEEQTLEVRGRQTRKLPAKVCGASWEINYHGYVKACRVCTGLHDGRWTNINEITQEGSCILLPRVTLQHDFAEVSPAGLTGLSPSVGGSDPGCYDVCPLLHEAPSGKWILHRMMDRNYPTSCFADALAPPAQPVASWAYDRSTASIKPR